MINSTQSSLQKGWVFFTKVLEGKAGKDAKNSLKKIVSRYLSSFGDVLIFFNLQVQVMSRSLRRYLFCIIRILWRHVGPCPLPIVSLQAKNYKDLSKKIF